MSTAATKKPALGRGLGSLLTSARPASEAAGPFVEIELARIVPMADQPRRRFDDAALAELAESIRATGIIQPLVVRRGTGSDFELIAGERRLRAARLAGLERVPAVVRDVTDEERFVLALVENIQRRDLDAIEEAAAYARLIEEHRLTQDELAQRVGKSRPAIANSLRLLQLPAAIRAAVADQTLSAGHARALLGAPEEWRALLAERIVTDGLNVRGAEELARVVRETGRLPGAKADGPSGKTKAPRAAPGAERPRAQVRAVERQLMERLGTRVEITEDGEAGRVVVHFADRRTLQQIVDLLLAR